MREQAFTVHLMSSELSFKSGGASPGRRSKTFPGPQVRGAGQAVVWSLRCSRPASTPSFHLLLPTQSHIAVAAWRCRERLYLSIYLVLYLQPHPRHKQRALSPSNSCLAMNFPGSARMLPWTNNLILPLPGFWEQGIKKIK